MDLFQPIKLKSREHILQNQFLSENMLKMSKSQHRLNWDRQEDVFNIGNSINVFAQDE